MRFAVIGFPIEHSRSPEIYGELFSKHGIDADFLRIAVKKDDLPRLGQITEGLSGFAVTMPLKRAIIPYLDELDNNARNCGAVNIVKVSNGKRIGFNTDGDGLADALIEGGFDPENKRVYILGRGGAALSAAHALKRRGSDVTLLVRSESGGEGFRTELFPGVYARADLFINASPLGMAEDEDFGSFSFLNSIEPSAVFDMVYRRDGKTRLVNAAEERGILTFDGNRMLYSQALRAFTIFTGIDP